MAIHSPNVSEPHLRVVSQTAALLGWLNYSDMSLGVMNWILKKRSLNAVLACLQNRIICQI
ncbi:MAG: hypothetical protein RLY82_1231 [Pseudomonadota bacterium]|jgi:hypothetical protein